MYLILFLLWMQKWLLKLMNKVDYRLRALRLGPYCFYWGKNINKHLSRLLICDRKMVCLLSRDMQLIWLNSCAHSEQICNIFKKDVIWKFFQNIPIAGSWEVYIQFQQPSILIFGCVLCSIRFNFEAPAVVGFPFFPFSLIELYLWISRGSTNKNVKNKKKSFNNHRYYSWLWHIYYLFLVIWYLILTIFSFIWFFVVMIRFIFRWYTFAY